MKIEKRWWIWRQRRDGSRNGWYVAISNPTEAYVKSIVNQRDPQTLEEAREVMVNERGEMV